MANTPQGWTTDVKLLNAAALWSPTGEGTHLATERNLSSPYAAIMCTHPRTGDALYMFSGAGGSKFYLWNRVEGSVFEVKKPTTQQGIVDSISGAGGKTAQLEIMEV